MNILFFLTPKNEVAYVENDDTLRQVLEKIEYHKYTAIPMLNKNGKYVGTVTEGDLLRYIKEKWFLNNFIGIVRRSDILKYCYKQSKAGRQKQEEA